MPIKKRGIVSWYSSENKRHLNDTAGYLANNLLYVGQQEIRKIQDNQWRIGCCPLSNGCKGQQFIVYSRDVDNRRF